MDGLRELVNGCRRCIAALLLFVVALYAIIPFGQPLERSMGSAFSAATAEVSLASSLRVGVAKRVAEAAPPAMLPVLPAVPAIAVLIEDQRSLRTGPSPTGPPPAFETIFSPLSPRAPPAA